MHDKLEDNISSEPMDGFDAAFVWAPALQNLYHGHPEDFCELLRDYQFPLPDEIRDFLAKMLEGKAKIPPKRRQRNTLDVWEWQSIRVEAIAHLKRERRGDSRAQLVRERKSAISSLAQRYNRPWEATEKRFKQALARLKREDTVQVRSPNS